MKTEYTSVAGAVMLALANSAAAQEPMTLSNAQMDSITAGATVLPVTIALAATSGVGYGTFLSATSGAALAVTDTVVGLPSALAQSSQVSIGVSAATGLGCGACGATAASASSSAAAVQ